MDQNSATPFIDDKQYTTDEFLAQVDLSIWEAAVYCGSCHVGGGFTEKDRNGVRLSKLAAPGSPDFDGSLTAYTAYTEETFDPTFGFPNHSVKRSPWAFPMQDATTGNHYIAPNGWNTGVTSTTPPGKGLMIPNVKEMDCFYCHLDGYKNLMYSVMTYSGMHFAAPMAGSDLMDTNSMSPTFQGYNAAAVSLVDVPPAMVGGLMGLLPYFGVDTEDSDAMAAFGANTKLAFLSGDFISRIKGTPPEKNCRQCHAPSNLEDIPDMMRDFLSSAPMIYDGSTVEAGTSFTGLKMPAFDFNAPFGANWNKTLPYPPVGEYAVSPVVTVMDLMNPGATWAYIARIGFPAAMGKTPFNSNQVFFGDGAGIAVGGGNPSGTGPLYYNAPLDPNFPFGYQDQHVLKRSIVPFPRAEWFKRGDMFGGTADEVHFNLGCAGCHMDTKTLMVDGAVASDLIHGAPEGLVLDGKSLCDPGRGFDSASGIESGRVGTNGTYLDSRNTAKKCTDCHITNRNSDGVSIQAFGAPNPNAAHAAAGLLDKITQAVRVNGDGTTVYEETFVGTHLDVIDCAVCHVYKKQMVVRTLDSTSGNRYPNMLGFDMNRGMMGMFSDPLNQNWPEGNNLTEWTPLFTWEKNGDDRKQLADGSPNPDWRRKVYPVNIIVASLFNNVATNVDANGDGVNGKPGVPNHTYYDPWISRDMKAGMNFAPSGFAPIPVGFGGGAYQSAFAPDGSFTGHWQYVGVYGGNVLFSTPEELETYKAFRTSQGGKSWAGTQLAYIGGPYMVTHNVRPTKQFALGKGGCVDCHAPGKGFFDQGFNMTGTAINTQKAKAAGKTFMEAPAEIMQVVLKAGDLVTGAEVATKTGAPREVEFDQHGDWNATTKTFTPNPDGLYKKVTELSRGEALYPDVQAYTTVKGVVKADRAAWLNYLLNDVQAVRTELSATPVAAIASIAGSTGVFVTSPIPVVVGATVQLVATPQAGMSYTWTFSDGPRGTGTPIPGTDPVKYTYPAVTGATNSTTFAKTGVWTVTLSVKNAAGVIKKAYGKVSVTPAPSAIAVTDRGESFEYIPTVGATAAELLAEAKEAAATTTVGINLGAISGSYDRLYIIWGDGAKEWVKNVTGTLDVTHKFNRYAMYKNADGDYQYKMTVYLYNGSTKVGQQASKTIIVGD